MRESSVGAGSVVVRSLTEAERTPVVGPPPAPVREPSGRGQPAWDAQAPAGRQSSYPRGYTAPGSLRPLIAAAHVTRPWRSLATAGADHVRAYVALGVVIVAAGIGPAVAIPAALAATMVIARCLRGLECMVHEASHGNWWRRRRFANDAIAFVLAGIPTGSWVGDYRAGHLLHHGRFGTCLDPDRRRYEQLDIEDLDRSTVLRLGCGVLRLLPRYQWGWLRTAFPHPLVPVMSLMWCAAAVWLPVRLVAGAPAATLAASTWCVALLVALPVLRFVAEAGEHVYRGATTVFDATVSNVGAVHRLIFHPHNDGFHTVHHLWPGIPHHSLRRVHNALLAADPDGYATRLRYRRSVLRTPLTGLRAGATVR